jgi:phage-related protein
MKKWAITFYNERVKKELFSWSDVLRAKLLRLFVLIQQEGADLGMPLTCSLGKGLFEIRVKTPQKIGRVFFCYVKRQEITILHSFIKKTQETPKKELEIAKKRLKEVLDNELSPNSL